MPSYMMRDVPPELMRRARERATAEGRSLKWVILALLAQYADHGLDALTRPPDAPADVGVERERDPRAKRT